MGYSKTTIISSFVDLKDSVVKRSHHHHAGGYNSLMSNPYSCETELDELSPDDSVIDYAYISEDNFLLVVLLVSNGDVQSYYQVGSSAPRKKLVNVRTICGRNIEPVTITVAPDASFLVLALVDGDVVVIPMKMLLDVTWSNGSVHSTLRSAPVFINFISPGSDPLMIIPTSLQCFMTKFPPRPTVVMTNKQGSIYIIDLESRKCVAELSAPESLHRIDIISDQKAMTTDILVTSFTSAQWIIPLENEGRGFSEVLTTSNPSEFRQVEPLETQLYVQPLGILAVNSESDAVELYDNVERIGKIAKKKYKIPPDTWLAYFADNVLFVVSGQSELRCAIHFGLSCVRLDYSVIRGIPEWRILTFIPISKKGNDLPSCMIINERGLVKITQQAGRTIEQVASEFLFRVPVLSLTNINQVADACHIDAKTLKKSFLPCLLNARRGNKISQIDLARLLTMAKAAELNMDQLINIFSSTNHEETLLSELLRLVEEDKKSPLRTRVIELYAKKCLSMRDREDFEICRQKKDGELSSFLSRYPDVVSDIALVISVPMWKSACLLATRSRDCAVALLEHIATNGGNIWSSATRNTRSQILSCLFQLDWTCVNDKYFERLITLLCDWHCDFMAPAHYENCLRLADLHKTKFPRQCNALYLLSAVYLLSETNTETVVQADIRGIACGLNSSVAISFDDRLTVWGDITNQPVKQAEVGDIPLKCARKNSNPDVSVPTAKPSRPSLLPRSIYLESRPHTVSCGTEHAMVLTTTGQLYSWGVNKFGQCGVGHSNPVPEPQLLDGEWPAISQIVCGQYHSVMLCDDGSVWSWGWGLYGQLGQGPRWISDVHTPRKVKGLEAYKIVAVACGRAHSLLLTSEGKVLMTGSGSYGQAGVNDDIKKIYQFILLDIGGPDIKFTKITTKFYHSIGITEEGRIFEWGRNPQELKMKMFVMRRLKNANKSEERSQSNLPTVVPRDDLGWRETQHLLDGQISEISTGLSHSAVLTEHGSLFTWGKALDYQLGHGNKIERCEPHQLFEPSDIKWKHVECGGNHIIAVSSDGRCFGWGRNDMTQCGVPSDKVSAAPRKYFYQPKEGTKRCVQLPDDSVFVVKPALVPDVQVKLPHNGSSSSMLDHDEIFKLVKESELVVLKMASRHFEKSQLGPQLSCSVPVALCHLLAGNISCAIDQIGRAVQTFGQSEAVLAITSLAWEILANHEDAQTKPIMEKAFRVLPMTNTQRNSSQLRNLWPNVWDSMGCQRDLTADEKLLILENWTPEVTTINNVEIPSSSLRTGSARVRVWAQCGHVEPATVGLVQECTTCTDEWQEKVEATLGSTGSA